jgi:glycosyltransferase involved in cell wall biosynthesis
MNVWILNHYANLPVHPGPTRHFDLAKRLVKRGFDVTIIGSSFDRMGSRSVHVTDGMMAVEYEAGVRLVWIRSPGGAPGNDAARVRNMLVFAWRAWRLGRGRFGAQVASPDIILGSSPHLLSPLAAWGLARRFRAPFVLEIRDLWPETFVAFGVFSRRHPVVLALRALERFLYRRAARIITLLPEAWRYINGSGVPRERVVWIPNGVDPEEADPGPSAEADPLLHVVYYGSFGRANALEELIDAAGRLQSREAPVRFTLVGGGAETARLMRRAEQLDLRNLSFRGPVPRHAVGAIAREADAFVALLEDTDLYRYGTSLNKLFSYMGFGRPVILAGRMAHDYVQLARCGLTVPPRDAEALADAIEQLAGMSPEERLSMGARGRAYVVQHHDWDRLGKRLAGVLEDVIGAEAAGSASP